MSVWVQSVAKIENCQNAKIEGRVLKRGEAMCIGKVDERKEESDVYMVSKGGSDWMSFVGVEFWGVKFLGGGSRSKS